MQIGPEQKIKDNLCYLPRGIGDVHISDDNIRAKERLGENAHFSDGGLVVASSPRINVLTATWKLQKATSIPR